MKSRYIQLADDDKKARDHIRENFEVCAYDHTLSRKLWNRFSTATGPMIAITPDWIDLDQLTAYKYTLLPPADSPPYDPGYSPTDRIVVFVKEYLQTGNDAVAVCENFGATRKTYEHWEWGPPPPVSCYGDEEVYHILKPSDVNSEVIEDVIRMSPGHWGTSVCSKCECVPAGDILDEFLDEIVLNTKHIFMPIFDDDGILIWSPTMPGKDDSKR